MLRKTRVSFATKTDSCAVLAKPARLTMDFCAFVRKPTGKECLLTIQRKQPVFLYNYSYVKIENQGLIL